MDKDDKQVYKQVFEDEISFLTKGDDVLNELEEKHGWLATTLTQEQTEPDLKYQGIQTNAAVELKAEAQAHNDKIKERQNQWEQRAKLLREFLRYFLTQNLEQVRRPSLEG